MGEPFRAWHPDREGAVRQAAAGALTIHYPDPDAAAIEETLRRLEQAGTRLVRRPVGEIIQVIDAAAARLADPTDPLRQEAETLLPAATGYSPPMVRLILDRMTADWRAEPLRRLVSSELGDALDRFVGSPDDRGVARSRAYGAVTTFHVFAGNVPGVAVTSLIRALLVKSPSLGKLATGEPVLPVLFARAVESVDAHVGDCIALTYWPGGAPESRAAQQTALDGAGLVVVYGGEAATEEILARVPPGRRVVVHGPRFSAGAVGGGELDGGLRGVARRAARAVATFDQQGCVSPHAIWVEDRDGDRAESFATHVADALQELGRQLPRGAVTAAEASAIQQERGTAEMRAHQDTGVRVWAGEGTDWTVVLDPETRFRPSCLNRFVRVHPVPDIQRVPEILTGLGAYLQSFALEGAGSRLEELAHQIARAGAARITTFERLPWPPPTWHHDGAPPLGELVRWVDLEI